MDTAAFPSDLARFVHDLVVTGAWLDEGWLGTTAELLPASSHLERATEIVNLVAPRVEEHLALTGALAQPLPRSADGRTDG